MRQGNQWISDHRPLLEAGGLLLDTGDRRGKGGTPVYRVPIDEPLAPIAAIPPRPKRRK